MKLTELLAYLNALPSELDDMEVPEGVTEGIVQFLKKQVDRFRFVDASISVALANQIISIGVCEHNLDHQALGHMAKGDSLERQGKINEAWDELKIAEALYLEDENDVGWARTRIGLINVANRKGKLHRDAILPDLDRAHRVLIENGYVDKSIVLSNSTAISYNSTGDHQKAIEIYEQLLTQLEQQSEET